MKQQWQAAMDFRLQSLAVLRAEMYNTSAKGYQRVFEAADFLAGSEGRVEARIAELVAEGYSAPAAAALATSRQTREHNLFLVDSAIKGAHRAKGKRRA